MFVRPVQHVADAPVIRNPFSINLDATNFPVGHNGGGRRGFVSSFVWRSGCCCQSRRRLHWTFNRAPLCRTGIVGAGESTPEINSPATAAASKKLPGNAAAKLPGKGNHPFRIILTSSRSEADPIRNRSPTHRQNDLQPNIWTRNSRLAPTGQAAGPRTGSPLKSRSRVLQASRQRSERHRISMRLYWTANRTLLGRPSRSPRLRIFS